MAGIHCSSTLKGRTQSLLLTARDGRDSLLKYTENDAAYSEDMARDGRDSLLKYTLLRHLLALVAARDGRDSLLKYTWSA